MCASVVHNNLQCAVYTCRWKLTMPNVLLSCDAGAVHPRSFATPELCRLPQYATLWEEAMEQAITGHQGVIKESSREEVIAPQCTADNYR